MTDFSSHPLALDVLNSFKRGTYGQHHPKMMCFCCIDGREGAGRSFLPKLGEETISMTEIAVAVPPPEKASDAILAKLSFQQLKGVEVIFIIGHSACGGAQTALAYPDTDRIENSDVRNIVKHIESSGEDLVKLRDTLITACEGCAELAADLLARHLVLVSLKHVSQFGGVSPQIMDSQLQMVALYHVLNPDTGRMSSLERYDVDKKRWIDTDVSAITNMCERPDNCNSCNSCHDTIDASLAFAPLEIDEMGVLTYIDVPLHLRNLIQERRNEYQPQTALALETKKKKGRIVLPIAAAPTLEAA